MILKRSFYYHTNIKITPYCRRNLLKGNIIDKKLEGNFGTKQSIFFIFVCVIIRGIIKPYKRLKSDYVIIYL